MPSEKLILKLSNHAEYVYKHNITHMTIKDNEVTIKFSDEKHIKDIIKELSTYEKHTGGCNMTSVVVGDNEITVTLKIAEKIDNKGYINELINDYNLTKVYVRQKYIQVEDEEVKSCVFVTLTLNDTNLHYAY